MDPNTSKLEILDRFKEEDELEELSRIEETELLQSPKFKRLQSSSPPRSSTTSPSKSSSSTSSHNNENASFTDYIPRLKYKPSNQLLRTPTKPKNSRKKSLHQQQPLTPLNRQLPINFKSPTKVKPPTYIQNKISLTPAQRLEKRPGKSLSTSDILSSYEFKETVGRGAFANVYRAVNKNTGNEVAIKEIFIEDDDDILELMCEIDLLKILKHKNIVKYHGFIRNEKKLLIFLEYCSGGSLRNMYKTSGPLSELQVVKMLKGVLSGLIYLHEQGVVHRDVKAANILLTGDGNVKLTDFGVSTKVSNNTIKTFSIAGTPNWMAPEIISMDGTSTASDIWSLGATVVELLTGEPLYSHLNEMAALHAIVTDDCPPIPNFLSNTCKDFIKKCFEKHPSQRVTAKDLLNHEWLSAFSFEATVERHPHHMFKKKVDMDIERDFNSIKRLNTKKFLSVNTKSSGKSDFMLNDLIETKLANKLDGLTIAENVETKKFKPLDVNIKGSEKQIPKHDFLQSMNDVKRLKSLYRSFENDDTLVQTLFDDEVVFNLLKNLELKGSSDNGLCTEYLRFLHLAVSSVKDCVSDLVNFSGVELVSRFLRARYPIMMRVLSIGILEIVLNDSENLKLFVQSGGLKTSLKLLQEDYKAEKRLSLFIVNIVSRCFELDVIPKRQLLRILSDYPNFIDWLAILLMQFTSFDNDEATNMAVIILSHIEGSNLFVIKSIFLHSMFKIYNKLDRSNRFTVMKFFKSLKVDELPSDSNLLKFLTKVLKEESASKTVDCGILSIACSLVFNICHLNQNKQNELVKLDPFPSFHKLFCSALPCTEFIIPLICEFSLNAKILPIILNRHKYIISIYLQLLVDPTWQANSLDALVNVHEQLNDDEVAKLLLGDGNEFLVKGLLVDECLNYELYLERLLKLLSIHGKSKPINQLRLELFQNTTLVESIISKISKYKSDLVVQVHLFRLLKTLTIGISSGTNYEKVISFARSRPKTNILLIDQIITEIVQGKMQN